MIEENSQLHVSTTGVVGIKSFDTDDKASSLILTNGNFGSKVIVPVYMSPKGSTTELRECFVGSSSSQIVLKDLPEEDVDKDLIVDQASDEEVDLRPGLQIKSHSVGFGIRLPPEAELAVRMKNLTIKDNDIYHIQMIDGNTAYVKVIKMKNSNNLERGSVAHEIVVVSNETWGISIVLKLIEKQANNINEVLAMVDLNPTHVTPKLVCVSELKYVKYFMEYVNPSKTLQHVMDHSMGGLYMKDPQLGRKFVFDTFAKNLSYIRICHSYGWSHADLHASNILVRIIDSKIDFCIIDWGLAINLKGIEGKSEFKTADFHEVKKCIISLTKRCKVEGKRHRLFDELDIKWFENNFDPDTLDELIPNDVRGIEFTSEEHQKLIGFIFNDCDMTELFEGTDVNRVYQTLFSPLVRGSESVQISKKCLPPRL